MNNAKSRLSTYLEEQLARRRRMEDPSYRKSINDDMTGAADASSRNNLAALLMDSAAMAGSIGGKRSDASGVSRFAEAQNQGMKDFSRAMESERGDRENRYQMDAKVQEYLANKQQDQEDRSSTEQYRRDTLASNDKFRRDNMAQSEKIRRDEMAQRERLARSRPSGGGVTPYQSFQMEQAQQNKATAADERLDKKVGKLGDDLGNSQDVFASIGAVEDQIGFNLEDKDKNKGVDLPGISVPGLGRISAFNSDARLLQARIGKIFNTVLKDRSGATVTDSELERLRQEFAAGKFNTEEELLGALSEYKAAAAGAMQNIEAKYSPEAVAKYREQGGKTLQDLSQRKAKQKAPADGTAIAAPTGKTVVKEFVSPSTGKRKRVYSDGTEEILDASK